MKKLFLLMLLLIAGCTWVPIEDGYVAVHFCPGCEDTMLSQIAQSKSAKCAFYDLGLENLTLALEDKDAEVLVFEDNFDGFGTPVKSNGLMHNKFCVLGDDVVVTGSFNPTYNGEHKNDNNVVVLKSKTLAENYLEEFEDLKAGGQKKTKKTKVILNGSLVENYFCPEDNCQKHVLETLEAANKSIVFMTFSFTDKDIAGALVKKSLKINVTGVMEKSRINQDYNVFYYLNDSGIRVFPDTNPAVMHHKVFIVDEKIVITGSFNPTKNANERNDENILVIHDKEVASLFLKEFSGLA